VAAIRRVTKLPLDVHLMIEHPERLIPDFAAAGADMITVHQEACVHLHRTVQQIRELGAKPGVSINPGTPLNAIDEILPYVDLVLLMSVNPGFGGQRYIPTSTAKIASLRRVIEERGLWPIEIEVDGGVSTATIADVVSAGATVVVAGAAVFNDHATVAQNILALRAASARNALR
jgi:ribulose-phosphate 3-epimerase